MKVLVLMGILVLNGCAAFKTCELGKLPQAEQDAIAAVAAVASNPGSYVADLLALAAALGPGQVDCIAQAIMANPKMAKISPQALQNLQDYLNQRKATGAKLSCNP